MLCALCLCASCALCARKFDVGVRDALPSLFSFSFSSSTLPLHGPRGAVGRSWCLGRPSESESEPVSGIVGVRVRDVRGTRVATQSECAHPPPPPPVRHTPIHHYRPSVCILQHNHTQKAQGCSPPSSSLSSTKMNKTLGPPFEPSRLLLSVPDVPRLMT